MLAGCDKPSQDRFSKKTSDFHSSCNSVQNFSSRTILKICSGHSSIQMHLEGKLQASLAIQRATVFDSLEAKLEAKLVWPYKLANHWFSASSGGCCA